MQTRIAECRCGAVRVECQGDPLRVSVCHCLNCQRRSGSAFAAQARFPGERVTITGQTTEWKAAGDDGGRATFQFCPTCGSTIAYSLHSVPGTIAVPIGAFADPGFDPPRASVYEVRKHPWVAVVGDDVERFD